MAREIDLIGESAFPTLLCGVEGHKGWKVR